MKEQLIARIKNAAIEAHEAGDLPSADFPEIALEVPKIETHGDFATNFAMISAKSQKMAPRQIAEILIQHMQTDDNTLARIEIAGPGFINFFLNPCFFFPILKQIHTEKMAFGETDLGKGTRVQVEFVSANPTGPLHIGHGRGAALGDTLANILCHTGFDVTREYYINDSGRQIRTLGLSVYLRYREMLGATVDFPEDCYQGDYIRDIAQTLLKNQAETLKAADEDQAIALCAGYAADTILNGIKEDLVDFGVTHDVWFSEQSLFDTGKITEMIETLKHQNILYEKDAALWFKTKDFGDEKDRVVIRSNGLSTYFASDIVYHMDKYKRGFDRVIDIMGADHHGYVARIKASIEAAGISPSQLDFILVNLVNLLRNGEPVAMSTRSGEFVTLKDVVQEVGKDAARFIFLTRSSDAPLDFDLELAQKKSNDNPVYYVQYVHARIASILKKAAQEKNLASPQYDENALESLSAIEEIRLLKALTQYPEVILASCEFMEPHRITFYLMQLSGLFHSYYNKHRVLTDDSVTTHARLYLIQAVQLVIQNGLKLLGINAPETM